jgi:hypothetical protein
MSPAFAQVDYAAAALQGKVLDSQGKVVLGAAVRAVNGATEVVKSAVTTEQGYFLAALPPGTYRVEVDASGFSSSVTRNVPLGVGQLGTCDVRLSPGPASTVIEVSSLATVLDAEQTQQANFIGEIQVQNLPNVSRNFAEAVFTAPGVISSFGPALQDPGIGTAYLSSGFSIGGSNGRNNLVTIDGGENDYGSGAMRDTHVPIDSVQEFQVNRNSFEAEFGFTIGSAINMVTKSGTNRWQGSAATYFRDRATDAENFFNKLAGGSAKPFEQSAIFSATLGGPIQKNKLFIFTAPEAQKLDAATVQNLAGEAEFQGISAQANGYNPSTGRCPNQGTPTQQVTQLCYLTQLASSPTPLAPLGAGLLASPVFGNPLSNPILNALVAPNDGTFDGIFSSLGVRGIPGFATPRGRYFNWVTRADYTPGARDSFSLRFAFMHENDSVTPPPPISNYAHQTDYTLTGSWSHVAGPGLVNVLRAQVVPYNSARAAAPYTGRSEIDFGTNITLGSPYPYPYDAVWRRMQFDDGVFWTRGTHGFKFGFSYRPDHYDVNEQLWFGGQWAFADGAFSILNIVGAGSPAFAAALQQYNVAQGYPAGGPTSTNLTAVQSYLAGTPISLTQANSSSNARWRAWAHYLGVYAQDSWKATPRLTVNYGARFDYGRDPSPVPHSGYISPRFGVAWTPIAKTVFRAGGGLFVAPVVFMVPFYTNMLGGSGAYINQGALVAGAPSPPFPSIFAAWAIQEANATVVNPNPALTAAQLASIGAVIGPPGPSAFGNIFFTLAPNFKPAYTVQASASIARELTPNLSLEIGYLMYHSVHVEQDVESNFIRDTAAPVDSFAGPLYIPKPGTTFGEPNAAILQNNAYSSLGSGIYHGGTASLTRRFNRGLQLQASYTFSRAIDNTSDFSSQSAAFRPDLLRLERSRSYFDITHNFVAEAVYTTPFHARRGSWLERALADVTASPLFCAHTGLPFTLLTPGLSNGTIGHNNTARPWYEGRNTGIGPGFASLDLRISKAVLRKEARRLEVIAQSENLLNRTNFAVVNSNFPADPTYPLPGGGTIGYGPYRVRGFIPASVSQLSAPLAFTAAYPARQVSLALRATF